MFDCKYASQWIDYLISLLPCGLSIVDTPRRLKPFLMLSQKILIIKALISGPNTQMVRPIKDAS